MSCTYSLSRIGDVVTVTATSDLAGTVYLHWYRDGEYVGQTAGPQNSKTFQVLAGDTAEIDCLDTLDPAFDPLANAPVRYPARRSLWWVRSLDADTNRYRIDQQQDGGEWRPVGEVLADAGRWAYSWLTDRLDDLATYAWRIVPIDTAGNAGTPIALEPERIVRRPDAPSYAVVFDPATREVEWVEE